MTVLFQLHMDYIHGLTSGHAEYCPIAERDALAAELAGYKESHEKYCPSAAKVRDLEAALREIARRESEAREIVTQNRWPSTLAIDLASQARLALETKGDQG